MGEGWSDAMAEYDIPFYLNGLYTDRRMLARWTEHKNATIVDYVLGQYVTNNPAGIRSHPYSTSA